MLNQKIKKQVIISQIMLPNQANVAGNVHGGEIMKIMDSTAYTAARRYAHTNVVTARVDELQFHEPILIGDLVICTAEIVFVGHTSIEISVKVEVEDLDDESTPQQALSAYFTMVAMDRNGKPLPVPPLKLETDTEKRAFMEGKRRYEEHRQSKRKSA